MPLALLCRGEKQPSTPQRIVWPHARDQILRNSPLRRAEGELAHRLPPFHSGKDQWLHAYSLAFHPTYPPKNRIRGHPVRTRSNWLCPVQKPRGICVSFQPCLFEDTVQQSLPDFLSCVHRNNDESRLGRMAEFPVASSLTDAVPAI